MEEAEVGLMINNLLAKANFWISDLSLGLRSQAWVRWEPGWDTFFALATMLYMIPSYYLMANNLHKMAGYNFLFTSLFVLVLFPVYIVLYIRGEPLKQIGISRRRWFPSLLVSLIVVWRLIPRVPGVLSNTQLSWFYPL